MLRLVNELDFSSKTVDEKDKTLITYSRFRLFNLVEQDVEQIQVREWYQSSGRNKGRNTIEMKMERCTNNMTTPQDIAYRLETNRTVLFFTDKREGCIKKDSYQRDVQIQVFGVMKEGVTGEQLLDLYNTCWEAYVIKGKGEYKDALNCSDIIDSSLSSGSSVSPMGSPLLEEPDIDHLFHSKITDMFFDTAGLVE